MNDVLVCNTVADQDDPVEDSVVRWCHVCADAVWVSPGSLLLLERDHTVLPTCPACAFGLADTLNDGFEVHLVRGDGSTEPMP